jgi:mannose-1-phosphate guanylyltransferase
MLKSTIRRTVSPLCGIVLASKEAHNLKPFIKRLRGDALPKPYVRFTGTRSMLEHTYARAESLIPRSRLFTVINQAHLDHPEAIDQLRDRVTGTVVVEPRNKANGLELLLPLVHVHKRYGDSVVAVFPSDQFVWEEDRLMRYIRLAHVIVERNPAKLVLLGIKSGYETSEHGYVLPSAQWDTDGWGTYDVKQIVEKPGTVGVDELARPGGALCNTMLMVFNSAALLRYTQEVKPDWHRHLQRIRRTIGTPAEATVIREVYDHLEAIDFSKDLLNLIARRYPGSVAVLPVNGIVWSNWDTETRIVETLRSLRYDALPGASWQRSPIRFKSDRGEIQRRKEQDTFTVQ